MRFVLSVALLFGVAGCPSGGGTAKSADDPHTLKGPEESWCPDGFEAGANEACFAIPEKTTKDTPVLVYLHGMYQNHGAPEEWAAVRSATTKGFAVVIMHGKRGLCPWSAEFKDYYCWPQDPDDTDAMKGVIKEWDRALWQVDALLDPGTHKRYVLAFSNGGFFGSYVATHAMFPAQAWAIVNAGEIAPPGAKGKTSPPIMVVSAADDAEQAPKAKELHEALTKGSWPHAYCPHPGAHALTPDDVDTAVKFFKRDADGALKPDATTYSCDGSVPPPSKPSKKQQQQ